MNRRTFLRTTAHAASLAAITRPSPVRAAARPDPRSRIMTVTGPVAATEVDQVLPHEHVLVDFIGADQVSPERYQSDKVFEHVLPELQSLREHGCNLLFECTPAYLGRDPLLLRRLARASNIHLVTNTGYYGAANDKFVPNHARHESVDELARRWIAEWESGIDNTGIRPGFIKIGVDAGSLSSMDEKLVRAAAKTALRTGLTIAAHTGNGEAALDQLRVLKEVECPLDRWIWVHAQNEKKTGIHIQVAEQGAWVEFDGIHPDRLEGHLAHVNNLRAAGHLNRVLISHDAGWYHVGELDGGSFRPYTTLFTDFIPLLKQNDFSADEISQLTRLNPIAAFALRK